MAGLSVENVSKHFGETEVLKGVSLDIADGEFVSLVGPSGCGKSTLLRIIAGLEQASAGTISIGDARVDAQRAADRNLSMVFQSYALYPHLSVAENIAVPLKMRRLSGWQRLPVIGRFMPGAKAMLRQIGQDIDHAANMLEIGHLLSRKPGQLSGGQRQRVALGRALVREPAAFLLDEPLSNLDAKLRVQTRTEIAQLHRKLAATFVYVTHDQVEAMTMSDRIAVMMGGRVLQCAAPEIVYENPDTIEVAEFIGSPKINILPIEQDNKGRLSLLDAPLNMTLTKRVDGALSMGLRPETLKIVSANADLYGTVHHTENLGAELFVQVAVAGLETPVILRSDPKARAVLPVGAPVGLTFDPNAALIFGGDGQRVRGVAPIDTAATEVA